MAITDTSSIELRVNLSGRDISSIPETRVGLQYAAPSTTLPITPCITSGCSYESSAPGIWR